MRSLYHMLTIYHNCINDVHAGQDPKNFTKENLRRIRQIQLQSKVKQEEKSKPVKAVHKSDKYDHVPPKVTLHYQVATYALAWF